MNSQQSLKQGTFGLRFLRFFGMPHVFWIFKKNVKYVFSNYEWQGHELSQLQRITRIFVGHCL